MKQISVYCSDRICVFLLVALFFFKHDEVAIAQEHPSEENSIRIFDTNDLSANTENIQNHFECSDYLTTGNNTSNICSFGLRQTNGIPPPPPSPDVTPLNSMINVLILSGLIIAVFKLKRST